ncbi:aminopeptidase N [Longispora fulva]|uniref:Aminopeptidase N n=1 Tax=Longispora fulva TaxID=619741 RepID=A0A8J7GVI1_9ACTN|nr:aminopeptidase N [Longispora fulva]MBG6140300.1 aminopeptidase N [Longispora fulva]
MPGLNLSRDEAGVRGDLLRVDAYDVQLDLTQGPEIFTSTTVITFSAREPGASTFADLEAPRVHEIILNGRSLDVATHFVDSRVLLPDLAASNELRVVADCAYSNTGQGLHRTVDPVDGNAYVYTHFEVPDARRVFTTFEQPDLKGTFTFTVTAPADWEVFSNSPTPEPVDGVWSFAPTPRISTYITAVVAGKYHVVRDSHTLASGQVVPLAVACRASMGQYLDADEVIEVTKQGFDYFTRMFDQPYPFEKYDQIFVPEYNIGAMENVGCVTLNENYVFRSKVTDTRRQQRAETVLHELAHMWFGDLVTMRWWDDLWLKESFATYVSVRALTEVTRWPGAWTTFANDDKSWALIQDQLPSTHPIVADIRDLMDLLTNFDGITYAKGAAVLKQLAAWVGSDQFFAGIRHYFARHAWGNTTLTDLLEALEKTSGRDLSTWSAEWLQTSGPNTLRPRFTVSPDGLFDTFVIEQEAAEEYPTLRSHRIAIGLYERGPLGLSRTHRIELDVTGPVTEVPDLVGQPQPDLVLLNDDDLTYAKIRFDERSLDTLITGIGEFAESLPRALCWTATWDMVRSGELAARDYIRLVLNGIGRETDIGVVEQLLRSLVTSLERYVTTDAPAGIVADAAYEHMTAAQPGSDHQLAWARLYARVAERDTDLDHVAAVLDGSAVVPGLAIDTDLRWALLSTLARAGRVGRAEIEAELVSDGTTAGLQYAAGALAALPDPETKAEAWASVIDRSDLPNGTQEAVVGTRGSSGGGFMQAGQRDLLSGYVDRYFEALPAVWADRAAEISRTLVNGLYPRLWIEQSTIDKTDAFLTEHDPAPALRRILIEGRDDVVRALRARARDAA